MPKFEYVVLSDVGCFSLIAMFFTLLSIAYYDTYVLVWELWVYVLWILVHILDYYVVDCYHECCDKLRVLSSLWC